MSKELAIVARFDSQGFMSGVNVVVDGLKAITRAAIDMQKAMNGVPVNPGAPGKPPPTQGPQGPSTQGPNPNRANGALGGIAAAAGAAVATSVANNKSLLAGLAKASKETIANMGDSVARELEKERKALADLDKQLEVVNRRYADFNKTLAEAKAKGYANPSGDPDGGHSPETAEAMRDFHEKQLRKKADERAAQVQKVGGLEEKKQGIDALLNPQQGGGGLQALLGGTLGRYMRGAAYFAMARDGISTIAGEQTKQPFDFVSAEARQAQAFKTMGLATKRGDLKYTAALNAIATDKDKRAELEKLANSEGVQDFGTWFDTLTTPSNALRPVGAITDATRESMLRSTKIKEQMREYIDQQMQTDPEFNAKLDAFSSMAQGDLGMMRRFGGRGGFVGLTGAARARGMSDGEAMQAFESVRSVGGRGAAQRYGYNVLNAHAAGFDSGIAGQLAGSSAMLGKGASLLQGVMSHGGDIAAAERIGSVIASQVMSGGLGGSMMGFGGRMMNGLTGGAADMFVAHQNQQGFGGLGRVVGGAVDPYQQGANLLSAVDILGPNASLYQQKVLGNGIDMKSMLDIVGDKNADLPAYYKALGLNKGQIGQQFNAQVGSLMDRFVNDPNDNSPMAKALRDVQQNFGGDIVKYMNAQKGKGRGDAINNIGAFFTASGVAGDANEGQGMARLLLDEGPLNGKGKGKYGDAGAGTNEERQAATMLKFEQDVRKTAGITEDFGKKLQTLIAQADSASTTFNSIGSMHTSTEYATKSLTALGDAAYDLIVRLGGTPMLTPQEATAYHRRALEKMDASKAQNDAVKKARHNQYGSVSRGVGAVTDTILGWMP